MGDRQRRVNGKLYKLEKKFRPVRGKILPLNLKITHANYVCVLSHL